MQSDTHPHALLHARHQVVKGLCLDQSPRHLDILDEGLLCGRRHHVVELLIDDRPEMFDRREVGAVTWSRALLPEAWEVPAAPILGLPVAMSWSAVLLENHSGHL